MDWILHLQIRNPDEQNYGLTSFDGDCQSLKYLGVGMFIGTSYNNKIYSIENSVYNSGILKSSNDTRLLNDQLESIPQTSNAMVGIGSESKHIYVFSNHALWQLPDNDSLRLIAGSPGISGYRDGPGSSALFEDGGYVLGNSIAVDGNDNVFVADYGSGCIRKVDKSGNTTTVAGNIKYQNSIFRNGEWKPNVFPFWSRRYDSCPGWNFSLCGRV